MARVLPDVVFAPAPPGRRLRLVLIIVVLVMAVVEVLVVASSAMKPLPPRMWFIWIITALLGPGIIIAIWHGSRIRGYALEAGDLVVRRVWMTRRFPLGEFRTAEFDREAMAGSVKLFGNDGLGAISGTFRNRSLGRFRAFVTDPGRCVVLRGTGAPLVISPDDTDGFLAEARRRLG